MARWVVMPVYCHSRHAGMACLKHWIPAFAGMTGAGVRHLPDMAKGLSGWQQAHSDPRSHSGEGRNPVGYTSHSRTAGMTTRGATNQRAIRQNLPSLHSSDPPSSAARSRRRSTTYIRVGVDSGLRWNDGFICPLVSCRRPCFLAFAAITSRLNPPAPLRRPVDRRGRRSAPWARWPRWRSRAVRRSA